MADYVPLVSKPFDRTKDRFVIHNKLFIIKSIQKAYKGYNFLVVYDPINTTNSYFIGMSNDVPDGSMLLPCRRDGYGNYRFDCSHIIENNPDAFGNETCNLEIEFVETINGTDIYSIKKL